MSLSRSTRSSSSGVASDLATDRGTHALGRHRDGLTPHRRPTAPQDARGVPHGARRPLQEDSSLRCHESAPDISPLKALSATPQNLANPAGIHRRAEEAGRRPRGARRGATARPRPSAPPGADAAAILVTTPESLYLLLTSERSRHMLRTVRTVILDEIHAVIGTRRGAHLALSLERLRPLARQPVLRLGLSATQKPIEEVAKFLVGLPDEDGRGCAIVDEGHRRRMDLGVEIPGSPLEAVMSAEVWEEIYDRLTALSASTDNPGLREHAPHGGARRAAPERSARRRRRTAHHGSLSKEKRLDAETRLKSGRSRRSSRPRARARHRHRTRRSVCQMGSPIASQRSCSAPGDPAHGGGMPKGRGLRDPRATT